MLIGGLGFLVEAKRPPQKEAFEFFRKLRFRYFAGFKAGGAYAYTLIPAVYFGMDGPQVHVPAPTAYVMGVAYLVTKLRAFAADIAYLCHDKKLQILLTRKS